MSQIKYDERLHDMISILHKYDYNSVFEASLDEKGKFQFYISTIIIVTALAYSQSCRQISILHKYDYNTL